MTLLAKMPLVGSVCVLSAGMLLGVCGCGLAGTPPSGEVTFTVRVENVSDDTTLELSDDSTRSVVLSPGVWVVHEPSAPLFTEGAGDRGDGLEALAEDGDPAPNLFNTYADVLAGQDGVVAVDLFDTPSGETSLAPIGPGGAYTFTFVAAAGDRLSVATMFIPSNDLFFAADDAGIALFDGDGVPVTGDVTDQIMLWDAGTEVNEDSVDAVFQVEQQESPDAGPDEDGVVQRFSATGDGPAFPEVDAVIRITITAEVEVDPLAEQASNLLDQIVQVLVDDLVRGALNVSGTGGF